MHALAVGFGLGFFVAIQVGPMSLFLIRSTLRRGWRTGLAIGAGIAVIDTSYCIVGVAGAGALLAIHPLRLVLGLVGAAVLVILGVKTLWSAFRVRIGGEVPRIESKTSGAVLIVVGGALGSATWLTTLATGIAVARRAFGDRMLRAADGVAGVGLVAFGGALAYGSVHEH